MLSIKPLSAELQKIALDELGEVPNRIDADLQNLKLWIQQEPHLKARTDDQFLIQFLRGCKYRLEKTKKKIDQFYALRTKYPELLLVTDVNERQFRNWFKTNSTVFLARPLNDCGPRIAMICMNFNTKDFCAETICKTCSAVHELMLLDDPYACIYGITYVIDCDKLTMSHLTLLTPTVLSILLTYLEKTLPLRIKSVHMINANTATEQIFNIVKPILPDKFKQRIFFYGKNYDPLYAEIPKKYLPLEYGGENGCLPEANVEILKRLDKLHDYFKDNLNYGTEEKLRLGKPMDFDGLSGIEGSFRKLNVD